MPPPTSINPFTEILRKISYKPGWKIEILKNRDRGGFDVVIMYDSYESVNAAFDPIVLESDQISESRKRISVSIGKTVRQPEKRYFYKYFDSYSVETMTPEMLIKYVIVQTIKEAEMFEFDRWFKYEGERVFGEGK